MQRILCLVGSAAMVLSAAGQVAATKPLDWSVEVTPAGLAQEGYDELYPGLFVGPNNEVDRCTTITVGRKASKDGSTMTTHTNDCHQCDSRVMRVPAKDHAPGSLRPVYMAENMEYPRYIGYSRGPAYHPIGDQTPSTPIGYIPEVAHTYAYFDGSYGLMNEHQVGIGESTCSAKIWTKPIGYGGKALFDIIELSRIALERSTTAREAVHTIGSLAEQYGYYSQWEPAAFVREEAGETLTIIDKTEAWILNILADPSGTSAIWAAKRVPDEHVAVTANFFVLNEINLDDKENYMGSANLFSVAQEKGWWKPEEGPFSFVKAYAPMDEDARDKDYWIVRMWRVFDLLAPSLKLSPDAKSVLELPFSVKPERGVTPQDIMRLNRDLYQGTEFDLTTGVSAGPWGSAMRHDGYSASQRALKLRGEWARAISLMRTSYSTVMQARSWLPDQLGGVFWMGEDAPHSTVYIPFYAGAEDTSRFHKATSLHKFSRDSAWWAFDFLSNWIELKFNYMFKELQGKQSEIESRQFAEMGKVEAEAAAMMNEDDGEAKARDYITRWTVSNAENVVKQWWEFSDFMIAKYNDGYINFPKVGGTTGYPAWWLQSVGYDMNPRYKNFVSSQLTVAANPRDGGALTNSSAIFGPNKATAPAADAAAAGNTMSLVVIGVVFGVVGAVGGFLVGKRQSQTVVPLYQRL